MSYLDDPGPFQRGDGGALVFSVVGGSFATSMGILVYALFHGDYALIAGQALGAFFAFVVMSIIGIVAAMVVGLPLTNWLASRRAERPWSYPVLGSATGALVAWLLLGRGTTEGHLAAALGSMPGGVTGIIWWTFHRRHFQEIGD